MKSILLAVLLAILGSAVIATPIEVAKKSTLLGARECTWGPSYWCSNITNAKSCNAVSHCLQTVWTKHDIYPVDNDSICKICLDMVTQARDQLESNETQEEIKEVFEGSCNLIPIKIVRKECDKLADDFIPELIEALASQMEPNAVCSIAGLCNNANIDRLLESTANTKVVSNDNQLSCENCNKIGKEIETIFKTKSRDDLLEDMLEVCGKFSSFSDACSNIILTYYNEIYEHLNKNLKSENICHLSGVCAANFHKHEDDKMDLEIRPLSDTGVLQVKDDLPCELCEQLVKHLRDLLTANTTEIEFQQVLEGLCNQTKGFQKECLSIVDQYYRLIYDTLVNNLDAQGACFMIGVCKKGIASGKKGPIMPLVPSKIAQQITSRPLLTMPEKLLSNAEILNAQLPIDVLMGPPNALQLVNKGEYCTICEYFLHFLQEVLASPKNEDEIKNAVAKTCEMMPKSVAAQCHAFVDMYGDAIIALLIQNINPAEVCPLIKLCPTIEKESEIFSPIPVVVNNHQNTDNSKCPLCLFAVTEAIEKVRSDKSKTHIELVLKGLCTHLPSKLRPECTDFIETYSKELIEMLATDFTPDQICTYFKLCPEKKAYSPPTFDDVIDDVDEFLTTESSLREEMSDDDSNEDERNDILTNEIPDNTVNGQIIDNIEVDTTPECSICVQILKEVEKNIVNKKSEDQIKAALEHACDHLRKKNLKEKCENYVKEHEDSIVKFIVQGISPKQICKQLALCSTSYFPQLPDPSELSGDLDVDEALVVSVIAAPGDKFMSSKNNYELTETPQCILCEFVMSRLEKELADKKTQEEIKHTVKTICTKLPKTIRTDCNKFVDEYADLVISLLDTMPPKEICRSMMMCIKGSDNKKHESELEVIECGVCHGTVKALDEILKNQKIDDNIENTFEKACNKLPAKYYTRCTNLVQFYGHSIINLLKSLADSQNICTEIGMCYSSDYKGYVQIVPIKVNEKKTLTLGANECTFGPTHWCSDPEIAKKCGVPENYCIEHNAKGN